MVKTNKLFSKYSLIILSVLIATITCLSLGKTLQYYFYTDDYSLLYHLQHHYSYPWPYHNALAFFRPFYKLFGLQAEVYFALGILTFFLASLSVYFFIKMLTRNNLIAILSSLIFATGYIGLDQFTMMTVSSINNLNIFNVSLTLLLFILWLDTRKLRFYLATIFMFWFSIAIFPFRAFPLVLFLPTIEIVLLFKPEPIRKIFKKLVLIALRYLPFLLLAYCYGVFSYGTKEGAYTVVPQDSNSKVLTLFTPASLKELFAILGRLLILNSSADFKVGLVFFLGIVFISILFSSWKKSSRLGRCLLIVLFLTVEGYLGNLILLPSFDSNGAVNRYLTVAFSSYCAIFPLSLSLLMEKLSLLTKKKTLVHLTPILVLPLIVTMISLSRQYEEGIITERSLPAREFYRQLKNFLPSISGKNIFYFDHADYYPVASRFGSILLGAYMPKEVTLAVPYQVPLDSIEIVDNFDSLMVALRDKEVDINHIHTFYYDEKGLHQTTDKVLSLLEKRDKREIAVSQIDYSPEIVNPQAEIPISDTPSLTPMILNLNVRITPLNQSFFNLPFCSLKNQEQAKCDEVKELYENESIDKDSIFGYLLSRKRYYDKVKVEVSSSHPTYQGEFLIDDKIETWWVADAGPWLQPDVRTWIKIDLGEERKISRLMWIQLKNRVPSDYQIAVSPDGVSWQEVKSVHNAPIGPSEGMVIEKFSPLKARFVMLEINKTVNSWPPAVSEIEVIEERYENVDVPMALRIKENPFDYIRDEEELQETYDYLRQDSTLLLKTLTNKDASITNRYDLRVPVKLDGLYHGYQILLSPRGTELRKIKLELNYPARIEIGKMEIIHPSLRG